MAAKRKRARPGRPPKMARPDSVERKYRKILVALSDQIRDEVEKSLLPVIPQAVQSHDLMTRTDSWVDDVETAITRIRLALSGAITSTQRQAQVIGQEVASFNSEQWRRIVRNAVGVDVFGTEPWLQDFLKAFSTGNASLIQNIPEKALTDISGIVTRGVTSGLTSIELEGQIKQTLKATDSRARLIARDQVSKLNGKITKQRQQSIGIKTYTWSTSGDERVRKSHRVLDGMLCRWDNPSVYSDDNGKTWKKRKSIGGYIGHPGEDYQCRCNGVSNTDELINSLTLDAA